MNFTPQISRSLGHPTIGPDVRRWLLDMYQYHAVIAAALAIMHPDLYRCTQECMRQLAMSGKINLFEATLLLWPLVFNVVSLIANRQSPLHRDVRARLGWYDVLATFGNYVGGILEMSNIGLKVSYDPGTVVALCGKSIRHGAGEVGGDRICLAYFMRDKVHQWAGVRAPTYPIASN